MFESNKPSKSIGSTGSGHLINGKRLPSSGKNFVTYSRIGSLLGRNSVHHKVRDAILESYSGIYKVSPINKYVIGETGWPGGGNFWPHKTHENGMSVDFFVPVRNKENKIDILPTNIFNKFGYAVEFNSKGDYEDFKIDFESMALHLLNLIKSAKQNGLKISRVIFWNVLKPYLLKTKYGNQLRRNIHFYPKEPWIRHDEHYHVDFELIK